MSTRMSFFFITLITLAVIHTVATEFFLYWRYTWFDIPVHVLGGVCVALGISILPFFKIVLPQKYTTLVSYLLIVLMVGATWEIFEYCAGISLIAYEDFFIDTGIDLGMDLVGGVLGYLFIKQIAKFDI